MGGEEKRLIEKWLKQRATPYANCGWDGSDTSKASWEPGGKHMQAPATSPSAVWHLSRTPYPRAM